MNDTWGFIIASYVLNIIAALLLNDFFFGIGALDAHKHTKLKRVALGALLFVPCAGWVAIAVLVATLVIWVVAAAVGGIVLLLGTIFGKGGER